MLAIQRFLHGFPTAKQSLDAALEKFGIDSNVTDDKKLVVLNYSQFNSQRGIPESEECRGLVLEVGSWDVVAYPFRRFYNATEIPYASKPSLNTSVLWEKRDGTLCTLYYYNGEWHVATRGRADASGNVNNSATKTFRDLFFGTLKSYNFDLSCRSRFCYVLELTGPENRVVTPYKINELRLLAVRDVSNACTGFQYQEMPLAVVEDLSLKLNIPMPAKYQFSNAEHINNMLKTINGLDEGFVLCDYAQQIEGSFARVKIKSPRYLAASKLIAFGFDEGKALDVVLHGDVPEFILYFPEYEGIIENVTDQLTELTNKIEGEFNDIKPLASKGRKEFAEAAKGTLCPAAMFALLDKKTSTAFEFFKNSKNDEWRRLLVTRRNP